MRVPFLHKGKIAEAALKVTEGYESVLGRAVSPPIPVEDMIERHLKLNLEYVEFAETHDQKSVFGATYVKSRVIAVSKALLKDKNEGRLCFTCAHEAGHWVLHRRLIHAAARTGPGGEAVFCREKDARTPVEWQADYFASCLLMPENEVRTAFESAFGQVPVVVHNTRKAFPSTPFRFDICTQNWGLMADAVRQAGGFTNVSKQAMIIRLQHLGLLINHTASPMSWHTYGPKP
jgi:hypothetical protein